MNVEEAVELIGAMRVAYPNYNPKDIVTGAKFMATALGEYSFQECYEAMVAFCTTHATGFAPSIGELVAQIQELRKLASEDNMSDGEVWALVRRGIGKSGYNSVEVFESFPAAVKKAVGSAHQLYLWAIDENFNEGVVQSNFLKEYKRIKEQEEEYKRLPQNQRTAIEAKRQEAIGANKTMALEERNGD